MTKTVYHSVLNPSWVLMGIGQHALSCDQLLVDKVPSLTKTVSKFPEFSLSNDR